jgi:hypothetical protein
MVGSRVRAPTSSTVSVNAIATTAIANRAVTVRQPIAALVLETPDS